MPTQPQQPKAEPGVVAASVYAKGKRVADIEVDEAGKWHNKPSHVVWIGLFEPGRELLNRVRRQLNLHPLAIEDAEKAHQSPKIDEYGDALFIVARTAQMVSAKIAFGETHLFVGRGYVVTVRHGASASYQEGIDSLREVLAFAFEASLMMGQAQQSAITRKLAAWAAILAVPTAVAGIYGMNFEHMPELKWEYGYFAIVAIILALCGFLYSRFRHNGWL